MKSLIIDFTKDFNGAGYGNIVYIIGFLLTNIKNSSVQIFVKIDETINKKSKKTYRDTLCAINYLKFGDFNISALNSNQIKNEIEIDELKYLNDLSNNIYVINKEVNDISHFFNTNNIINDFNLKINFKNEYMLKKLIYSKFNDIENSMVINVRRGEKLNDIYKDRFLIVHQDIYHQIIKENLNKKIIFVSDDIEWCKNNFKEYKNVSFFDDKIDNKLIYDQFAMVNCETLTFNLDCSFSNVPFIISNNKIKNANIIISEKNNYWNNNKNILFNLFENIFQKNIKIINGKSER